MSTQLSYKNLLPLSIGFDKLFEIMEDELNRPLQKGYKVPTYPPYNIVLKKNDIYEIQIAVAGFKKEDISIELKERELIVSGKVDSTEDEVKYIHHGLSTRKFSHKFTLLDFTVVDTARIEDGVLKIELRNIIPEERKPKIIPISS